MERLQLTKCIHVTIYLNTNITEFWLYRKRPTVFKFGLFIEVNLSRSSGVFYRAIQKSEETLNGTLKSEERTRRRQTIYRPWRNPLQRLQRSKTCFFCKLIILQPGNTKA